MPRIVLIVEDTEYCATLLEVALLSLPDIELRIASTAQEALRLLNDSAANIAAMITDLHLPRIDGFDLIAQVRSLPRHSRLPILVVSGDSDLNTPERLRNLGADAYLPKPYSPAEVRHTLERLLNV
jgi:two-component system, chemotaxis family, chemotaxis protein CheY